MPTDPAAPGVIRIVNRFDTDALYRRMLALLGARVRGLDPNSDP